MSNIRTGNQFGNKKYPNWKLVTRKIQFGNEKSANWEIGNEKFPNW